MITKQCCATYNALARHSLNPLILQPPDANSSLVHEPGSWIMGLENEVQVVPGVGQGLIWCKKHLGCNWVVVKIMVPFWVPEILGAVLYSGPQKGTLILTTTQFVFRTQGFVPLNP